MPHLLLSLRGRSERVDHFERFFSYMAMVTSILDSEPSSYEEVASQQVWREAMQEKHSSIMKNDVWEVVPRPEGKSVVASRWLYKVKHAADGNIEKFKARFVARGFFEVEGVDYEGDLRSRGLIYFDPLHYIGSSRDGLEDPPDRCEDCISQWLLARGGVH